MQTNATILAGEIARFKQHFRQLQILNNDGIHANLLVSVRQSHRLFVFMGIEQGVERHEHLGSKEMGIAAERFDIFERVARSLTRAKTRPANIHRIRTCINSSAANRQILSRRQQFNMLIWFLHCSKLREAV